MIRTKRILIVGGGSSGWMAAAYLDAALNRDGQKVADISLIESPDVPRIGVGEATIPSIKNILAVIGIDEVEFLRRVDGTGRVPATELLVPTPAVAALIRDDKTRDITNIIQGGRSHGMHTLDDSLLDLLGLDKVSPEEAWSHARNKGRFEASPYSAGR